MLAYFAAIAILLAAILWAHWYVRRQQSPTSAINGGLPATSAPLPRASVHPDMQKLADELDAETERWLWKALAKGTGYRVWRSDPMFEGDQIKHAFAILAPDDDMPGEGTVFSWT